MYTVLTVKKVDLLFCYRKEIFLLRLVVPNPCLAENGQYFPYAFSERAYIQCDAGGIHFQPCSSQVYWNQAEKVCAHKRKSKQKLSSPLKKLKSSTPVYGSVVTDIEKTPEELAAAALEDE